MLLNLPPAVTVAVIAGAVSIAGAAIALIQAKRTEKIKADTSLLLEKIKAADERRRRAFELATQETEPLGKALSQVWGNIQIVREVIYKATAPARFDQDLALQTLRSAVENISIGYGQWGASLSPAADRAWHSAKNAAGLVESLISQRGAGPIPLPTASPNVDERLRELRSQLHDYQTEVQEAREGLRATHMRQILEAM